MDLQPRGVPEDIGRSYYCAGCLAEDLLLGCILALESHPDAVWEGNSTCVVRVGATDVMGRADGVTLNLLSGHEIVEPAVALELAAAIVRAATFATRARSKHHD